MSTNYDKLQESSKLISKCIALEEQYRLAKFTLANSDEIDLSVDQITDLKASFSTNRDEIISLLNAIVP